MPLAAGRCSNGSAQAFHPSGDGSCAHGEEPVQGALHGAAGGHSMDRHDQGFTHRPHCGPEEEPILHLEDVSALPPLRLHVMLPLLFGMAMVHVALRFGTLWLL